MCAVGATTDSFFLTKSREQEGCCVLFDSVFSTCHVFRECVHRKLGRTECKVGRETQFGVRDINIYESLTGTLYMWSYLREATWLISQTLPSNYTDGKTGWQVTGLKSQSLDWKQVHLTDTSSLSWAFPLHVPCAGNFPRPISKVNHQTCIPEPQFPMLELGCWSLQQAQMSWFHTTASAGGR